MLTRREFLGGATASIAAASLGGAAAAAPRHRLVAAPTEAKLVGGGVAATPVWAYGGTVPGPVLRVRQGEEVEVLVENRLAGDTTVHWHGVRVPFAMDGVPHLTQPPIRPGESFRYVFEAKDAGTFWYHPHERSFEQVDRGPAGALVVEERAPPAFDRDVLWLLDDWRLERDASIAENFGHAMDVTHAGRLGNTVTVNGRIVEEFALRPGERIRLRLVNAANARIFALAFAAHRPLVIAYDGQPVEPHLVERLVLAPAQRVDVVLDGTGAPGTRHAVVDGFYPGQEYRLLDLVYDEAPLRASPPVEPVRLPPNELAEPDLAGARRLRVELGGGMMDPKRRMSGARVWTMNDISALGHEHPQLAALKLGESCILELVNDSAWPHPMHLHGHSFRVLTSPRREWRDTVLLLPRERAEIAFVADNPGEWMFHCHILEHQLGGMMATIRVG
jgi:FtsP/CotA-like multicopper oxidase with cupredoxin domain